MEWMLVCCLWIYLGTAAALVKKQVQIGDHVTLDCDINVKNNGHYEIEWRTLDRMVAKSVNGILTPGCGFKDRLYLDGVSLTITHTQYDDHGQYECWYDGHQKSWSLQIDIHNNLTTTVGQPVWIPCYEKLKKCSKDGRANEISFEWWKDKNPVPVFQMEKGARVAKGRAEESPDVKQGNFSLVFHKAYFSDSGTYRCSEQEESTILRMKGKFTEFQIQNIGESLSPSPPDSKLMRVASSQGGSQRFY
ncbi:uncharacterized protein LOC116220870 [Clupea harengus]|uniref:Uncharacterized protein LOC116220870 n=1 Tax=Clupea harengus TaxID=7950 RepID=A0A6P8FRA8_CLUHA|nr:uncharacterized protein LOC116220870 [Clupea harengus]